MKYKYEMIPPIKIIDEFLKQLKFKSSIKRIKQKINKLK